MSSVGGMPFGVPKNFGYVGAKLEGSASALPTKISVMREHDPPENFESFALIDAE